MFVDSLLKGFCKEPFTGADSVRLDPAIAVTWIDRSVSPVIPVKEDYNMYWKKQTNNELIRIDDANKRKSSGKKPLFMSLSSFATVIKPELIMEERRIGDYIGCVIVEWKKN